METAVLDNAVRGRLNAWFFDFLESYRPSPDHDRFCRKQTLDLRQAVCP